MEESCGRIVQSLLSFEQGNGNLDQTLKKQTGTGASAGTFPNLLPGLMSFPPIAVVEEIDPMEIGLAVGPASRIEDI